MLSRYNKDSTRNSRIYGGIKDPTDHMNTETGSGWKESKTAFISGIDNITQAELEVGANNCTLTSITRIMKYYYDRGYTGIPKDIKKIYKKVREIGVKNGYDPKKTGLLRGLFVYTPWEIDNLIQNTWKAFGYPNGNGNNSYLFKLRTIKSNIDNSNPLLLNITSGYYKDHTVSVIGYTVFSKEGENDKTFVQIYDGWNDTVRYIDWTKFGNTPASVTRFLPPVKK
jgi:hypothetical protein